MISLAHIMVLQNMQCNPLLEKGPTLFYLFRFQGQLSTLKQVNGRLIKIIILFNCQYRFNVRFFLVYDGFPILEFDIRLICWERESKQSTLCTQYFDPFYDGILMWLISTLILNVLAMSFHVSAFFDQIQDAFI